MVQGTTEGVAIDIRGGGAATGTTHTLTTTDQPEKKTGSRGSLSNHSRADSEQTKNSRRVDRYR
jgi:hypothetical protein